MRPDAAVQWTALVTHHGRLTAPAAHPRRGMALLAALVLLALSAALATVTFSAAHALRRAALGTRAQARVEAGVRRTVAEVLLRWNAALDTMPVGTSTLVALDTEPAGAGPPLLRAARVDRTAEDLYSVTVDVRAFTVRHPMARRRARLWLQRPARPDSLRAAGGGPVPPPLVTPWGLVDLY